VNDDRTTPDTNAIRGTRRGLLGLAGASILGLVAGRYTKADEAEAADGAPLNVGQTTTAETKTQISTSGVIPGDGAFVVDAPNASYGIHGSAASVGVYGKGPIGVLGTGAVGGVFAGTDTALSLTPTGTSGPSTTESLKGDVLVDKDGVMWFCIADGTPGTWIKLSHGGTRYLAAPVRVYDSRDDPAGGKLRAGAGDTANPRVISIVDALPELPQQAVGVVGNLTVTEEEASGFASIWPGGPWPGTSNINYVADFNIANAFSVGLSPTGTVSVASYAATHVILDVAGYVL
jgi:hypothetical protein